MTLKVNPARIQLLFEELSNLTPASRGYTRLPFSAEEKKAHRWLADRLKPIGCEIKTDAVGNTIGRYGDKEAAAFAFGSHLDTVPNGGLYDGALGVIAAIETLYVFAENNCFEDQAIELICFTGEESNPMGGTFGSRAMAGLIKESEMNEAGAGLFSYADILQAQRHADEFKAFLELHIEQGITLEMKQQSIGIPTDIAGMTRLDIHLLGEARHAGTTIMEYRKDALVMASALVIQVNEAARSSVNPIVATVGELHLSPNVPSVVPGEVRLIVEIRGIEWTAIEEFKRKLIEWMDRNVNYKMSVLVDKQPGKLSTEIQTFIEKACISNQASYQYMFSGANHDANAMSTLTKTGMLFVPSKDGISHHPDEYTSPEEIHLGIQVFLDSMVHLINGYRLTE